MSDEILKDVQSDDRPRLGRRAASFSIWRAVQTLAGAAFVLATLFTLWTSANLFNNDMLDEMMRAAQATQATQYPTLTPSPRLRIGLVSGHMGHDSGAVCPDGLTEAEVNYRITSILQGLLKADGYDVDLLEEFDTRLKDYRALALISIHNDSCIINNELSGFKVAAARESGSPESARKLTTCLIDRYGKRTGLKVHYNTITRDMTEYHAFTEIDNKVTTAVIIETGFLATDRKFLTENTDVVAEGIREGILCFVRNEPVSLTPTPRP
jgi:N-acetylmuramoyl-L-alanine amidase